MDDNSVSFLTQIILKKSEKKKNFANSSKKFYKGTFTSDLICKDSRLKLSLKNNQGVHFYSFIVNTITSYQVSKNKIGHWLGIIIKCDTISNKTVVYFIDSLGKPFTSYEFIKDYISDIRTRCKQNSYTFNCEYLTKNIQNRRSNVCGIYVVFGVTSLWENSDKSLSQIFSKYLKSGNSHLNDKNIVKFLYKHWQPSQCHNRYYPWKILPISKLVSNKKTPSFCPKSTLNLRSCLMKMCACYFGE